MARAFFANAANKPAFPSSALTQTINGLTAGANYDISFYWAGAQVFGYTGPTTDQWQVSLGSQTQFTSVYSNPGKGFSGWMKQTFTFTADNTSDVLSFMAIGTPITPSEPPFALLDGVSVTAVPEPSTWVAMCVFMGGFGVIVRRRARAAKSLS